MKNWIGLALIVGGVLLGLYLGVWVMFIGGIVQLIEAVRAPELSSFMVACGVARIVFAGFVGWGTAIIMIAFGRAVLIT